MLPRLRLKVWTFYCGWVCVTTKDGHTKGGKRVCLSVRGFESLRLNCNQYLNNFTKSQTSGHATGPALWDPLGSQYGVSSVLLQSRWWSKFEVEQNEQMIGSQLKAWKTYTIPSPCVVLLKKNPPLPPPFFLNTQEAKLPKVDFCVCPCSF